MARSAKGQRVLRVADELFYRQGIGATGVDAIVAGSGVAKTTLYAHYGSKDRLVAEYLATRHRAWRARIERAAAGKGPAERVLAVFSVLGDWFAEPEFRGCPFINAAAELPPDHAGHAVIAEHRSWLWTMLGERAAALGVDDAEAQSHELVMLYDGAIVSAVMDGPKRAAQLADEAARRLVGGTTGR
jgi:AcrR family transcriptional regulator